jgi:putative MATE family efflux protein
VSEESIALSLPREAPRPRYGEVLRFAIPVSLELALQSAFGMVDQLFVASLGEASFVGAGLTAQLISTLFVVLVALLMGAAVQLARHAGAQDVQGFSATGAQLLQLSVVVGLGLTLVLRLGADRLLQGMGAEPAVVERGVLFIRLVSWSLPLMALSEACNHVLRARGDVRSPVVIGLISLATNTGLNALFIFGAPGVPAMGLEGVAVATVLARGLGLVLVLWRLVSQRDDLRVSMADLTRLHGARMKALLMLSLPILAGQAAWTLGMLAYTRVYAELGTPVMAAHSAIGALEGLLLTFSMGLSAACVTLVGRELGRGDAAAAQALAGDVLRVGTGMALVTGALLCAASLWVGALFPRLAEGTLALAVMGLVVGGFLLPVKTLNMILANGVLRGGGDVRFVFACEGILLVGIASTWALGVPLGLGYAGALAGRALEEVVKLAVFSRRYLSQRWMHELR